MVLERLIGLKTAVQSPFSMFIVGAVVSIACLVISFIVFSDSVGMFTTILITMAMTPFMVRMLWHEEEDTEEEIIHHEENFLTRHSDVLQVYGAFFCGVVLALSITFIVLPEKYVQPIFEDQINEINVIRGNFLNFSIFERILLNNISVLTISFLFSFLFGSGAIFILAWNATVLSTAIGLAAKSFGGVAGFPMAVLMFFPHGSLEILAYLVGAVGGGLVSSAVVRKHSKCFWSICEDSLKLMAIAVVLLVVAAFVESMAL
jgi:uncharacterized membrane protein SpoIIM required for sporulation